MSLKKAFRNNFVEFKRKCSPCNGIADYIFSREIITAAEKKKMERLNSEEEQVNFGFISIATVMTRMHTIGQIPVDGY